MRYSELLDSLREAYDGRAAARDARTKAPWKLVERQVFLDRLEDGCRLLEIGAGTGHDSLFFTQQGLSVVATDLSPGMVEHCRAKGLDAHVMDFLGLDLPAAGFDAIWAMNCLLHVPNRDLPMVLESVRAVLRPGGLFFVGVYGADVTTEGPVEADDHVPPRFFAWRSDADLLRPLRQAFEVVDFHVVDLGEGDRFQSATLRRPAG